MKRWNKIGTEERFVYQPGKSIERKKHERLAFAKIRRRYTNTFRVLKSDLDLRPIYHKTDHAAMAHLHLGMLAYWLVATIRYQLKQQEINFDWRIAGIEFNY